jgi:hypothetical protein
MRDGKTVNKFQYPTEPLRKKLVVAGIPESEHSVDSLAAKIPADFNGQSFQAMSTDMVAELLLYFIAFQRRPASNARAIFQAGTGKKEACVWLVGDLTIEEARNALAAAVPDLGRYMAQGQMQIRHYTELYTNANGTVKPPDQLSDQFVDMGSTMKAKGFAGLRASGSVSWVDNEESMSRFMDYETKVNCAIQNSSIMAVCTYPAHAATFGRCRELIHNHGKIFVKRGEWVHDKSKDAEKIEAAFASLASL